MKFTTVLCKSNRIWRKKILYKTKGIYNVDTYHHTDILTEQGKHVIDVTSPDISWHLRKAERSPDTNTQNEKPKLGKRFIAGQGPIYIDESRYKVMKTNEKTIEVCHLTTHQRFTEGIEQACLLTKTQKIEGLPASIAETVGKIEIPDQNELVQRLILQSQVWDNSDVRLNRRIDRENIHWKFKPGYGIPNSKSAAILIHNFIRLAMYTAGTHPGVARDRQLLYKPNLETAYRWRDNLIRVHSVNECMIVGRKPLTPIADRDHVNKSCFYEMPDMFPISPTIDFERVDVPMSSLGNQGAFKTILDDCYPKHPHIMFRGMNFNWWPEFNQAYNLMLCFATAITEARNRFGIHVNFDQQNTLQSTKPAILPEPIVIHNVNTDWQKMNFITFQLNTLDISNNDGVKNIAWVDTGNALFHRQLPKPWKGAEHLMTRYDDYNPDVFKKFLAVFLNGVKEERNKLWEKKVDRVEPEGYKFKWFSRK